MDNLLRFHGYTLSASTLPLLIALVVCGLLLLIRIVRPRRRGWILEVLTLVAIIVTATFWQRLFYPARSDRA